MPLSIFKFCTPPPAPPPPVFSTSHSIGTYQPVRPPASSAFSVPGNLAIFILTCRHLIITVNQDYQHNERNITSTHNAQKTSLQDATLHMAGSIPCNPGTPQYTGSKWFNTHHQYSQETHTYASSNSQLEMPSVLACWLALNSQLPNAFYPAKARSGVHTLRIFTMHLFQFVPAQGTLLCMFFPGLGIGVDELQKRWNP